MSGQRCIELPAVARPPSFTDLSEGTRHLVLEAERLLPEIPAFRSDVWASSGSAHDEWVRDQYTSTIRAALSDPLGAIYLQYHGLAADQSSLYPSGVRDTLDRERALVSRYRPALIGLLTERRLPVEALENFLEEISSGVLCRPSRLRTQQIYLAADAQGNSIRFPPPHAIREQLSDCLNCLRDETSPAVYRAALSYVYLIGIHPFLDGNGRVARIFFACVLALGGLLPNAYIPIKQMTRISLGAMLIKVRRALVLGDWDGACGAIAACVSLTAIISNQPSNELQRT